jgi:hypothetical protein
MQCRSCGEALVARAVFCPNCGKPVDSGNSEFSPYEYGSSDGSAPYGPSTPIIESSSATPNQQSQSNLQQNAQAQVFPIQQFNPYQQLYADPQTYSGQQFYQEAPPLSQGNVQQSPGADQPPSPQPQKRGGPSIAMIVLLVVLALLVGTGSVIAYIALAHRPAQQTQTTTPIPTTAATLTTTSAQTVPTITTSDPQQLYTQATSGTPALTDPLNSSNPNGWEAVPGYGNYTFSGNAMHISATQVISKETAAICVARSTNFGNFAYQVSTTISQGNITGVVFRVDSLQALGLYLFAISSDRVYLLGSGQYGATSKGSFKLLAGGSSQAIKTGVNQANLLTVIARGSTIYLYANQQYLASVNDSTSSIGWIGVFGENTLGGPVDVAFSAIQVWQL